MLRKAAIWGSVGTLLAFAFAVALGTACSGHGNDSTPVVPEADSGTDSVVADTKPPPGDTNVKDTTLPPCEDPTPTRCGDNCVDLQTNPFACGSCGYACTGSYSCVAAKCACAGKKPTECKTYDDAGTVLGGICVDTTTDPANCGKCGMDCGGAKCVAGLCGGA